MSTCWKRQAPGWYVSTDGSHEITRVEYHDGPWWIVTYPDGAPGDPFETLRDAKMAVTK